MPNHVTNKLLFHPCTEQRFNEILSDLQKEGAEPGSIDLGRIIPEPEDHGNRILLEIADEDIDEDDEIPVKSRWKCDDDCDNWWEEDDPNYTDDLYDSFDDDCGQDCSCDECEYFCPNCGNCVLV